jgi:hypothetical protein
VAVASSSGFMLYLKLVVENVFENELKNDCKKFF